MLVLNTIVLHGWTKSTHYKNCYSSGTLFTIKHHNSVFVLLYTDRNILAVVSVTCTGDCFSFTACEEKQHCSHEEPYTKTVRAKDNLATIIDFV